MAEHYHRDVKVNREMKMKDIKAGMNALREKQSYAPTVVGQYVGQIMSHLGSINNINDLA